MHEYRAIAVNGDGSITGLAPQTGCLAGHPEWDDADVATICAYIYHEPRRISWTAADASLGGVPRPLPGKNLEHLAMQVLNTARRGPAIPGKGYRKIDLRGKVLADHDRKQALVLNDYYAASKRTGLFQSGCLHPLPLLTLWAGQPEETDYHGSCMNAVGSWWMDRISVEDSVPDGYEVVSVAFQEEPALPCAI